MRRVHLYSGLALLPWVLVYGISGFLFNHGGSSATAQRLPVAKWALVAFYKRVLPELSGGTQKALFLLDPHFLAYMTVTIPAMLAAALLSLLIGIPTLRLRGDYFAIVTLGFAQILLLIVRNEEWLTSGPSGIKNLPTLFSFSSESEFALRTGHYYLGLFFFAISLVVMMRERAHLAWQLPSSAGKHSAMWQLHVA